VECVIGISSSASYSCGHSYIGRSGGYPVHVGLL